MLNVIALMPLIVRPSRSTPRTSGAEEGADDGAGPAGERGAADDRGGDAVGTSAVEPPAKGSSEAIRIPSLIPAESGQRGRQHEVANFDLLRLHSRFPRPIGLPPVATVYTPHRGSSAGREARQRVRRPKRSRSSQAAAEPVRQCALRCRLRATVGDRDREALEEEQRAEGRDERRACRSRSLLMTPLTCPTSDAPASVNTMADRQRPPPLGRRVHQERCHRVHVTERQIDLAGDQQHHLGDRPGPLSTR